MCESSRQKWVPEEPPGILHHPLCGVHAVLDIHSERVIHRHEVLQFAKLKQCHPPQGAMDGIGREWVLDATL